MPTGTDTVTLHNTRADADTGANPISTGTSFSYKAVDFANKIIFLRATSTSNASLELISSHQVPASAGSYSFSSLQFGENKQLLSIIKDLSLVKNETNKIASVKAKTDRLNFTGGDVKATLDNEAVTTDIASRTAVATAVWNKDISSATTGAAKELKDTKDQSIISANNTQKN